MTPVRLPGGLPRLLIVCGEDIRRGKTDPETYIRLAADARVEPGEILSFENPGIGVTSAAGASIPCIAVPNRFTGRRDDAPWGEMMRWRQGIFLLILRVR